MTDQIELVASGAVAAVWIVLAWLALRVFSNLRDIRAYRRRIRVYLALVPDRVGIIMGANPDVRHTIASDFAYCDDNAVAKLIAWVMETPGRERDLDVCLRKADALVQHDLHLVGAESQANANTAQSAGLVGTAIGLLVALSDFATSLQGSEYSGSEAAMGLFAGAATALSTSAVGALISAAETAANHPRLVQLSIDLELAVIDALDALRSCPAALSDRGNKLVRLQ